MPRDTVLLEREQSRSYPYRVGALVAMIILMMGVPWVGTAMGPNPLALAGVVLLAVLVFLAVSAILSSFGKRLLRAEEGASGRISEVGRAPVSAAARSVLAPVNTGVLLASCAFFASSVGIFRAALHQPPIALLDPVLAGFGVAGILGAVWTHRRVNRVAGLARGTVWDALLLRLRFYLLTMTLLTVFAAAVSAANSLTSFRADLTDIGAGIAGGFAWASSLDVREWARRAVFATSTDAAPGPDP